MTVDALVKLALRDCPFFAHVGGVTVGGGEPTCQYDGVHQLLMALQNQDIHTVMETNGTHSKLSALFPYIAFLLIDLKHPDDAVCQTATRQGNTTILENIQARFQQQQPFRVRIPLVPGFNDDPATLDAFGRVLSGIGRLEVEVLPFHRRGETKWKALGQPMPVGMTLPPEPRQVERACARLAQFGLTIDSTS